MSEPRGPDAPAPGWRTSLKGYGWAAPVGERLRALGRRTLLRTQRDPLRYADIDPERYELFERVRSHTQTSLERIVTLADAVEYVVRRGVPGDLVECGVWRGGSSMAIALTLLKLGVSDRRLWLYDTFGTMPAPGEHDRDSAGRDVAGWETTMLGDSGLSLPEVRAALRSTGYADERIRYVPGLVEQTIPAEAPERIALLRLDTDWYSSTRYELEHLYPRLEPGGVLIVDDYGHLAGARKAVDDYFAHRPVLLTRVDYTGRMAVKT